MRLQSGAGEERTGKEASRGRGSSWTGVGSLLGRWEPRRACGHPTLCLWLGQQQGGDTPQTPPNQRGCAWQMARLRAASRHPLAPERVQGLGVRTCTGPLSLRPPSSGDVSPLAGVH